jgi:peptidoglycan hydrolase CwlO-like protein
MNDGNRELIKRLEQEEKSLKEERRLNKLQIDSLKNANTFIIQEKNKLEQEVKKDSLLVIQYKSEAKKSSEDLEKERKEYEQILKDIDAIRTNPPNRVDDALLKSLRDHLNKRMKK